ncbi:unnamed protein product [Clavelina lepadiformis]|uniref:Gelsolin-like domain-containing protein n=1 Tax=Clavelina lepadiformis TaxID=159417 RepID=A0ABP0GWT6_CLALP
MVLGAQKLQVWRIENFEKVPVPRNNYGYFFTGDSYIVMNETKDADGNVVYDLHMWIGSESSQDEYGACAILTTQLDDEYGGAPIQHRETQGYESALFMGYFRPAIKYEKGGVASGFKHVEINDYSAIKRLMWVRGRRQVRADIVPMEWSSLNKSDCFIFDMGHKIYTWSGPKSNRFEGLQATIVAKGINDDERGGKAKVIAFSGSTQRLEEFLGSQSGDIAEGEPEPVRASSQVKSSGKGIKLFRVSDDSGKLVVSLVSDKSPFQQSMLESGNVYIVSNAETAQIYVWKGKDASTGERKGAMKTADSFIEQEGLPKHARITVMAQNAETSLFKILFRNWTDADSQKGLGEVWSISKIAKVAKVDFDASTLHEKPDLAAKYQLPDDGSGDVQIWRIEGINKNAVSKDSYGQFYGGDCYIVLYSYKQKSRQDYIIYYWIGSKATKDEVTALPILTIKTDDEECNGAATQIRVTQGKEPPHMLMLFGGKPMIVNMGGTSRAGGQTSAADTRLFHVKSGFMGRCRAVEVDAEASNLNSNDAFLLITPDGNSVWCGKGASETEISAASEVTSTLGTSSPSRIEEGEEPSSFWSSLGGKADYASDPRHETEVKPARLFECCDASGNFTVEEVVGGWTQDDLNQDNVMLLDAWTCIYVWIGKDSSEQEKTKAPEAAEEYLNSDPTERDSSTPICKVQQGNEPISFKGFFQGWED